MNTLLIILLILAGVIVLLFLIAAFMKRVHYVRRGIEINVPVQQVFDFLRFLDNQEKFNKWAATDADRVKEFRGTDGTQGFIYAWSGNKKAGQGEKEIMELIINKRIATEIRFIKPMAVTASAIFELESLSESQTQVYLINTGSLKYPLNLLIPMAEKNFARDIDDSLEKLKGILEGTSR